MGYQQPYQQQYRYRRSIASTHSAATAFRAFLSYPVEDPAFAGHQLGGGFLMGLLLWDVLVAGILFLWFYRNFNYVNMHYLPLYN